MPTINGYSLFKFSTEKYRKHKICPVVGCNSKPQVRLANHIKKYHPEITTLKRKALTMKARKVSKKHVKPDKAQRKLSFSPKSATAQVEVSSKPSTSMEDPKRESLGSTRDMKFFPLSQSEMVNFHKYLTGLDGGKRSPSTAKLICKDLSKYLYFCNKSHIDWAMCYDKKMLIDYVDLLKDCVGPEGILTKLERIGDALKYIKVRTDDATVMTKLEAVTESLKKWKYTLRKEKKKLANKRIEALSDNKLDLEIIQRFINDYSMWNRFDDIIERAKKVNVEISDDEKKFCLGAVVVTTLYESWQRPGAVSNCTLEEFQNGSDVDGVLIVLVTEHKTGVGGSAKLMFKKGLKNKVNDYLEYIRPRSVEDYLFLTVDGKHITKVGNLITYMSKQLGTKLPSATSARKGGATAAAASCSEADVRLVTRQLAHDPRVHNQFYEAIRGKKDAKKAYDTMQELMNSTEIKEVILIYLLKPWLLTL